MRELKEKALRALAAAREVLNKADAEGRAMTSEEHTVYTRAMEEFDTIDRTIKAGASLADIEARAEVRREAAVGRLVSPITRDSDEYRDAFRDYIVRGEVRADLKVGTTTSGGYLVPTGFERTLIQALEHDNVFRQLGVNRFTTDSGNTIQIPSVTTHGTAAWLAEAGTYATSDETFGQASMSAYKLTTAIKVSEELMADSAFDLNAYLAKEFGRRFAAAEETAFVTGGGSGSTQPTGISATVAVGITTTGTNSITADELIDFYHSLGRQYRERAVIIMNDSTIKAVRKLKTSTAGDYVWQPGLQASEPDRILGRPVYSCSAVDALATGKKVAFFFDPSFYWVRDVGATQIQRLVELYSMTGFIGIRGTRRVDGLMVLADAGKALKTA